LSRYEKESNAEIHERVAEVQDLKRVHSWPITTMASMTRLHGYMVQFVGVTERAGINKEYEEMLTRLCKINDASYLPQQNRTGKD
jgi:hypothetical protein